MGEVDFDHPLDCRRDRERVRVILEPKLAVAAARFDDAMELQVKQVLDGLGVSVAQYAMYLAFGRELWALTRKEISGESAAMEADVLLQKWVGRGMAQAVLEAIRTQVFNIVAPTP